MNFQEFQESIPQEYKYPPKVEKHIFLRLDADKNGKICENELKSFLEKFKDDGSGCLSKNDYLEAFGYEDSKEESEHFAFMDKNNDDQVCLDEIDFAASDRFLGKIFKGIGRGLTKAWNSVKKLFG